jgi:hypothetical protein
MSKMWSKVQTILIPTTSVLETPDSVYSCCALSTPGFFATDHLRLHGLSGQNRLLFYPSILYLLYFYSFTLYDTWINSNHYLHVLHLCLGRGVYCGVICLTALNLALGVLNDSWIHTVPCWLWLLWLVARFLESQMSSSELVLNGEAPIIVVLYITYAFSCTGGVWNVWVFVETCLLFVTSFPFSQD